MKNANLLQTRIDALLNVLSEDVLILSQQGTIIFSSHNDSAIPWGGADELTGKQLTDIFPGAIASQLQGMIDKSLGLNQLMVKEVLFDPTEFIYLQQQGMVESCWVEIRMAPSSGDEPSVVCRIEDISRRKMAQRESSQIQRDLLTGMYNRRALMPVLAQSIAQAIRYDWVCSLMLIDVDSLRLINDQRGWDVGDQILKRLAESLNSLKRTADFLARVGEDGFAILLPETNAEQGILAAERVHNMVSDLSAPNSGTDIAFTVSIGVATLTGEDDSAESMFNRAESSLQLCKQQGGNQISGSE
ncbi:sensor domain-containing diguanylate cyclase [Amphritea pacifica]|uniref:sensor domain-containing diguanylate cyclase n=1 Tax=Amphritea pacifica TaxID=2811233 RepID=UPI001963B80B|nr:sensor domain-containing diguanylate cyclase [Amphritea pacifica]MBN1006777.1 GGDEF domain-containing protein [Amphritea pacifica]